MSKVITYGFDVLAQLSADFIGTVLGAAYGTGRIPYLISKEIVDNGVDHKLDIYVTGMSVNFCNTPGLGNALAMNIQFLLRTTRLDEDFAGRCSVVVPYGREERTLHGRSVLYYAAHFAELDEESFSVTLTKTTTFIEDVPDSQYFHDLIREALWNVFANEIRELPITPSIMTGFQLAEGRIFYDPTFTYPPYGEYQYPNFFAYFLNILDVEIPVPDQVASFFRYYMHYYERYPELEMALPVEFLLGLLDQAIENLHLPADLEDIILNSLSYSLNDNFIDIEGNCTYSGIDADFTGRLVFSFEGENIRINIVNLDIDLPWYVDFLDAIIGGAITRSLEESTAGLGFEYPSPFTTIFQRELPLYGDNPPVVEVNNCRPILLENGGVRFRSFINLIYEPIPRPGPPTVRAHKESKEFHRVGCKYGDKIRAVNLIVFKDENAALNHGYDGCAFCYPEYDKTNPGQLTLYLTFTNQPPDSSVTKTITWYLELIQEKPDTKGSKEPVTKTKTYELKTDDQGVCYSLSGFDELHPGRWLIRVTCESWTAECTRHVVGDRRRYFRFTYGKAGCESAWL